MTDIFYIDFQNKKLVEKKVLKVEAPKSNLEKLEYFSELLSRGLTQVLVNSNIVGVKLPPHMIGNPAVQINWSHNFRLKDFVFDELKVSGTLSFNKQDFHVILPWESIWMIYRPDEGEKSSKVWAEDTPKSILRNMDEGESN